MQEIKRNKLMSVACCAYCYMEIYYPLGRTSSDRYKSEKIDIWLSFTNLLIIFNQFLFIFEEDEYKYYLFYVRRYKNVIIAISNNSIRKNSSNSIFHISLIF